MRFSRHLTNYSHIRSGLVIAPIVFCVATLAVTLGGCSAEPAAEPIEVESRQIEVEPIRDVPQATPAPSDTAPEDSEPDSDPAAASSGEPSSPAPADGLAITEDFRDGFDHGPKPAANQRYIVLHDTEGDSDAASTIDWWDSNGNLVAAHFIVNRDGTIWQCVPLDRIAHHAGYGDTGHNDRYGITEDGRDDMAGSSPIGAAYADYAMNAWSVGIEMVHVGGEGDYPEAQLEAVDDLIAYIDDYYGFESEIIDHKAWRSGNSDTSPEFADYLESYQAKRTHA